MKTHRFLTVLLLAAVSSVALADALRFDIPAQPLPEALRSFADQAKMQLLYQPEAIETGTSKPVVGEFEKRAALEMLLKDTGFEVVFSEGNAATVRAVGGGEKIADAKDVEAGRVMRVAQVEGTSTPKVEPAQEQPSSAAGNEATEQLDEIVVTAQKRLERLQDVPISITALSGEELDRSTLTGVHEILSRVPGMAISRDADTNGQQLTLRGVTAAGPKGSGASPIAYYIDSIPFGFVRSAIVPDLEGYDLNRIEVLRGPQGTLYGAGGEGGVVRVLTKDADLDEYEFKARASLLSMSEGGRGYRGDGAVNIPIVEGKLGVRVVAGYQKLPGWIDRAPATFPDSSLDAPVTERDINEGDQHNLRLKIGAHPSDRLSIGVSAWNSLTRYDTPQLGDDNNHTPAVQAEPNRVELDMYGLNVQYDFAAFSLSSMSSYVDYASFATSAAIRDFFSPFGLSGTFDTDLDSEVYSQEVLLNSRQEGPWRWSAGVFYRNGEDLRETQVDSARTELYSDFSEQTAVFGEVGRRFWNDRWEWALGLRYFHDDVAMRSGDDTVPGQENVPLTRIGDTFHALTPRAVLTWHPNADLMVYGTYGQGFRSGAQQVPLALNIAPQFPAMKPDKLHNYEIGAKGGLWGGQLSFETALYYLDWKDTQQVLSADIPNQPGVSVSVLTNASSASGLGLDVTLTARPLKGLEVGTSFSTNDLTFDEDVRQAGNVLLFSKGDRLASSPKYTINPFVAYSFPLGASDYRGRFSADASYISPANTKKLGDPSGVDGAAVKLARAGFELQAPQHWNVSVNVDNLTNYQESASAFANNPAIDYFSYRERPRTVSLQFEYEFN